VKIRPVPSRELADLLPPEHIEQFMTSSPESAERLISSYAHLNSLLGKPTETQQTNEPKELRQAMTTLRPTYLCLQCKAISTLEERDSHCKSRKHMWCKPRKLLLKVPFH
jgi:hypothetical protein